MDNLMDRLIGEVDRTLRTLSGNLPGARPMPRPVLSTAGMEPLPEGEKRHAAALMRVNHVGEVCAQALYHAQAAATGDAVLREHFQAAAGEENDHLVWTRARIDELGGRTSLLNPLWYAASFALGTLAGRAGDRVSLGFVVETERQVEQHLDGHLNRLPRNDLASRAVLEQMSIDEARHGLEAQALGAKQLPWPARAAMRVAARVVTATSYWI